MTNEISPQTISSKGELFEKLDNLRFKMKLTQESIVLAHLAAIAKEADVRILFACESGSRAWGFESEGNDYDVRFVYARGRNAYLTVSDRIISRPEQLNFQDDEDGLDIWGWDISKFLRALYKGNSTPFEWMGSPIVYEMSAPFKDNLATMQSYWRPLGAYHHYKSMGRTQYESYQHNGSIKKLLYALRCALCVQACTQGEHNLCPPAVDMLSLAQQLEVEHLPQIQELVRIKKSMMEGDTYTADKALEGYILEQLCSHYHAAYAPSNHSLETVDDIFRSFID